MLLKCLKNKTIGLCLLAQVFIVNSAFAVETSLWSYVGRTSPDHWSKLDRKFQLCGEANSPFMMEVTKEHLVNNKDLLMFDYQAYPSNLNTSGYRIDNSKHVLIGVKDYKLIEFHIHLPAEHSIDNKVAKAAIHFINQDAHNNISVIAVMIKEGESNKTLKELIASINMPDKERYAVENGNLMGLIPDNKEYYHYMGQLSTPPCTDKVNWYVLKQPIEASAEELTTLLKNAH